MFAEISLWGPNGPHENIADVTRIIPPPPPIRPTVAPRVEGFPLGIDVFHSLVIKIEQKMRYVGQNVFLPFFYRPMFQDPFHAMLTMKCRQYRDTIRMTAV
ncbi:hypothetical protein TNCV_1850271 [Trichonephila clavipes]|nr:hypothetical protein TNCV_1850271 [Trichonephila clavipes]